MGSTPGQWDALQFPTFQGTRHHQGPSRLEDSGRVSQAAVWESGPGEDAHFCSVMAVLCTEQDSGAPGSGSGSQYFVGHQLESH